MDLYKVRVKYVGQRPEHPTFIGFNVEVEESVSDPVGLAASMAMREVVKEYYMGPGVDIQITGVDKIERAQL